MSTRDLPRLAISMGDPLGIGPEVVARALLDERVAGSARWRLYASRRVMDEAARLVGVSLADLLKGGTRGSPVELIEPEGADESAPDESAQAPAGRLSFACFAAAIEDCKNEDEAERCTGLVTAPISKEHWHAAGFAYPGHTEVLAERFASPRSAMLFVGPHFRVILVTVHVPLREVAQRVTKERVLECLLLGDRACRELGVRRGEGPRIGVAGINPHAGEHGLFGDEDERLVAPAVKEAVARGVNAIGPLPGDVVFLHALRGEYDLVVAMYHDQGLIPVKLLDREEAVNVTTGLEWNGRPIVRTSPAHGTAMDIAWGKKPGGSGSGNADASSMKHAMLHAVEMAAILKSTQ